jgi:hypothetical protein
MQFNYFKMSNLLGLYKGVVVFDSDVADSKNALGATGRVKVKIEGVSYSNSESESYRYPRGKNITGGILPENIKHIDNYETWAYVAAPVMGESSMGKYNASRDAASTTDSSDISLFGLDGNNGSPPAAQFGLNSVGDAYVAGPDVLGTSGVNTYGYSYFCDNRSHIGKGVYAIPAVGTHVIIQFLNGSKNYPIIVGVINSISDIKRMFGAENNAGPSYPNAFSSTVQPLPQV